MITRSCPRCNKLHNAPPGTPCPWCDYVPWPNWLLTLAATLGGLGIISALFVIYRLTTL